MLIARFGLAGVNNKKIGLTMNLEIKLFLHSVFENFINDKPIHHIVDSDHLLPLFNYYVTKLIDYVD